MIDESGDTQGGKEGRPKGGGEKVTNVTTTESHALSEASRR